MISFPKHCMLWMMLFTGSNGCNLGSYPARLQNIPPSDASLLQVFARPSSTTFTPTALAFGSARDGISVLYVADREGFIEVWDTQTWNATSRFRAHDRGIESLAVSADGQFLVSCPFAPRNPTDRQCVRVWDTQTWENVATFDVDIQFVSSLATIKNRYVSAVAISSNGCYVAYQVGNHVRGKTHVLELLTGREVLAAPAENGPLHFRKHSPNTELLYGQYGAWIFSAGDARRLPGRHKRLEAVTSSGRRGYRHGEGIAHWPSERLVSSGGVVEIQLPEGRPLRVLLQERDRESATWYWHLQVSSDDRYLLKGDYSSAYLISLSMPSEFLICRTKPGERLEAVQLSRDNLHVAACGGWGLKIWHMP